MFHFPKLDGRIFRVDVPFGILDALANRVAVGIQFNKSEVKNRRTDLDILDEQWIANLSLKSVDVSIVS